MDPATQKVTPSMSAAYKKPQPRVSRFKEHLDEADKVVATYPPNYLPPSPSSSNTSHTTSNHSDHPPRYLSASPLLPVRSSSFPPAHAETKSTNTLKFSLHRILARFTKGTKGPRSDRTLEMNANPCLQTRSDPARVETWDRRARLGVRGLEGYLYYHPAVLPESTTTDARSFPEAARPGVKEDIERPWEVHAEEQDWSAVGPDPFDGFSGVHCHDHLDDLIIVADDVEQDWSAGGLDPFEGFSGIHCQDHMDGPIVANHVEQDGHQAAENPKRFMNHLEQRLGRVDDRRDVSGVPLRRYRLVETYVSEAVHHFSDHEATLTGSWSGRPTGDGGRSY